MKVIIMTLLALSLTCVANAGTLEVKSKDFTCAELNQLVQEEGTVHIKWLGSLDVHSRASDCNFSRNGRRLVAFQTTWRTMDKRFCVAGYSCKPDLTDEDTRNR